jgi:uncharacterized pyridoxamine 5'-phosphate oxidase family protein
MSTDDQPSGGKKIVRNANENINVEENSVLKKLFEKDPILKDLFERDRELQKRIEEREEIRRQKLESLKNEAKAILGVSL